MRKIFQILLFITFFMAAKAQELSKINIKIEIEREAINKLIDQEIPKEMSDEGTAGKGILSDALKWSYTISRGDIEYSVYEDNITAKAPLKGEAKASIKGLNKDFALNLSGSGGIESNIVLTKDWRIEAKSTPVVELNKIELPVDIPLKKLMDRAVEELDKKLGAIDLKPSFEKIWKDLEDPLLIDKEKDSWLSIKPVSVKYSGFSSDYESIQVYLMIDAYVETFIGRRPENNKLGALPEIERAAAEKSFAVYMPINAKYSELEIIAERQMRGETYPIYLGSAITVEDIGIRGEKETTEVAFDFTAHLFWGLLNYKGRVSLSGIPAVDANSSRVVFKGLNYQMESDSFILENLNRIFNSSIRKKLNDYLQQAISELIIATQRDINRKLEEVQFKGEGAVLKANLETLKIEEVSTSSEEITINTYFDGEAGIKIKKLNF